MFLIKTKLGASKIHGIGVFTDQFISKGTLVQKFIPGVDVEITQNQVDNLPSVAKAYIHSYAYKHKRTGNYILPSDDTRFLNHSETPNLISSDVDEEIDVAVRDIQAGEELTVNYKHFDADWNGRLEK